MKLGVSMYSFNTYYVEGKIDVEGFINFCGDLGVQGVDLLSYYWKDEEREVKLVPKLLRDNNLTLALYGVGNNFVQRAKKRRMEQIGYVKQGIDMAARLNTPLLRVFGGRWPTNEDMVRQDALKMVVECLFECIEYAKKSRIILALQNHGPVPGTSQEVLHIISSVDSPFLRSVIDPGCLLTARQDPLQGVKDLLPYAVHFDLEDLKKVPKGNLREEYILKDCVLGEGSIDFESCCKELKETGYDGFLSLEFQGPGNNKEGVEKGIAFAKKILNRIQTR